LELIDFEPLRCICCGVACKPSLERVWLLFFGKIDFVNVNIFWLVLFDNM